MWELTEVVRLLPPERLLVMVFTGKADYDRFRSAAEDHFTARVEQAEGETAARLAGFRLPDYPPLKNPDAWIRVAKGGTQGFITFGPDWEPEFVRIDPTAVWALSTFGRLLKVMRRQVNPALRRVKLRLSEAPDVPSAGVITPRTSLRSESHDLDAPPGSTD